MSELLGIARFKMHEGKLDEFKRLSAQAMEIVRTKGSGTLQYDTYFNDDESECVVIERYRDSEAAMEHAANLAELSAAILETVSVVHGEVLGEPRAELRANLADSDVPQLFTPYESIRDDAWGDSGAMSPHARGSRIERDPLDVRFPSSRGRDLNP